MVAGIHVKAASEEDITKLKLNSNKAIETLCKKLKKAGNKIAKEHTEKKE